MALKSDFIFPHQISLGSRERKGHRLTIRRNLTTITVWLGLPYDVSSCCSSEKEGERTARENLAGLPKCAIRLVREGRGLLSSNLASELITSKIINLFPEVSHLNLKESII